jgi:DNA-binding MarR family transcriptional regulator
MNSENIKLIEEIREFLAGTWVVSFEIPGGPDARYRWVEATLVKLAYWRLRKAEKGLVIRYLIKMSGYSRQQVTRLIRQFRVSGRVRRNHRTVAGFSTKYTPEDVKLLAELDELHDTLSGPATRKLCERAFTVFNDVRYERLAHISVSHLYNLRGSKSYKNRRWHYEKTKPKVSNIGQRCKPNPDGNPVTSALIQFTKVI